ncbi:MAG: hypothetical protein ACR2NM_09130 [Bythopirellula sp.]
MSCLALNQYTLALLLSLGFLPNSIQAQQLQQPASVLPWAGAQPEIKLALRPPVSSINASKDVPAWLDDSVSKPVQTAPKSSGLHRVETERFVDLGPLDEQPYQPTTGPTLRQRSNRSKTSGPLSFFKALGIRANWPHGRN